MPVPLPPGTRLLHIGPQKTGTSALQQAMHDARDRLEQLGVHYAGSDRQQRTAAAAVVLQRPLPGKHARSMGAWPELVAEVHASRAARVVVSAEMFAAARPDRVPAVVEALDPGVHVVVTLRPLLRLMPSQWQQYVQNGLRVSYPDWLEQMLRHAETSRITPTFWHRHRHDALVRRWADVVGPERVTVVALDEGDRRANLDAFESLLDLPAGTLVAGARSNRSLTLPEIELVRAINVRHHAEGWTQELYELVLHVAFHNGVKERDPHPDEPRIETPAWAERRADEVAAQIVAGLAELQSRGVQVLGDLGALRPAPRADEPAVTVTSVVAIDLAAHVAVELVRSGVVDPRGRVRALGRTRSAVREASSRRLLRELRRRGRRRLTGRRRR